jgi:hypothetical protein
MRYCSPELSYQTAQTLPDWKLLLHEDLHCTQKFLQNLLLRFVCENVQNRSDQTKICVQKIPHRKNIAGMDYFPMQTVIFVFKITQMFEYQATNHQPYWHARPSVFRIQILKFFIKVIPVNTFRQQYQLVIGIDHIFSVCETVPADFFPAIFLS